MPNRTPPNFLQSIKRTVVPVIVGALVAWAARINLDLPPEATAELVTVVVAALYYAAVRWFEGRFPWLGNLLGGKGSPSYDGDRS